MKLLTASGGQVATLLVEANRQIVGRQNRRTGLVELAKPQDPTTDELLDELGELTSAMGGKVMVLPAHLMPVQTGLAATCRH